MGNRLSKIVTRTGDDGTTGLGDGTRVSKAGLRVDAIGGVDELNCALGVLLAAGMRRGSGTTALPVEIEVCLTEIQHDLFDLGGELAVPGSQLVPTARVEALEAEIEHHNAALPPLKEFVLPGGGHAASACHMARAICRRAERHCWSLARDETVNAESLRYLNRLSDLLFVLGRVLARAEGGAEVLWKRGRDKAGTGSLPDTPA
jgi:cob(I)alamin adenosyltransferase